MNSCYHVTGEISCYTFPPIYIKQEIEFETGATDRILDLIGNDPIFYKIKYEEHQLFFVKSKSPTKICFGIQRSLSSQLISDADSHIKLHCPNCLRITENSNAAETERCHTCLAFLQFECSKCKYLTVKKSSLDAHMKHNHTSLLCPKCKLSFLPNYFSRHLATCGVTNLEHNSKIFTCSFCDFGTNTKAALVAHSRWTHLLKDFKSDEAYVTCNECKYSTKSEVKLSKHVKENHTYVVCPNCRRTLTYKQNLDHRQICGKMLQFKCVLCDFMTKRKKYLRNHMISRHSEEGDVACTKCGKTCKTEFHMRRHLEYYCSKK